MTQSKTLLSRRSIVRIGGVTASAFAFPSVSMAASGDVAPVDRGSVADGGVKFPPIAAASEASEKPGRPPLAPKDRIGFAIVALGRLTMQEILPAFAQSKLCKVTALVSGSPEKLKAVGAQYAIPPDSLYSYDDFDRIAQNENVQVVYIVLPNAMHKEFVLRAAAAKKHVLCEKPIATNVADAQAMVAACADAKVKLMVAYRCRYQPHHLELIKRAQSGALGSIKMVEAINAQTQGDPNQWRLKKALSGGGALPDVGIYCLNAARAVLGEEPIEIEAQIHTTPNDPRFREVEESVTWLMRFPSGALANLSTSYGIHRASRMAVHCDGGGLVLEKAFPYKGQELHEIKAVDEKEVDSLIAVTPQDHFAVEMDHMAECVMTNSTPRTPGEEGVRDSILTEAIYRAADTRTTVKL